MLAVTGFRGFEMNAVAPSQPVRHALAFRVGRRESYLAVGLALAVAIILTFIKVVRLNDSHGDDALFLQLTQNAGVRGVGRSELAATILDFAGRGLANMTAASIAANPLAPTSRFEFDEFRIHSYFILYPIGLLARIVPKEVLLESLFVSSFIGLALLAYVVARSRGISLFVSAMLCALVVWHPAWADAFEWEFYPDRLFVLIGFALMLTASDARGKPVTLIALAVLCSSINERAAAIGGIFLIARALLYWRTAERYRTLNLAVGAAMLVYAGAILRWYLDDKSVIHQAYGAFFPSSPARLIAYLRDPVMQHGIALFLLANAALLILAAFDVRAITLAVLLMLPNIVGTYGGAEKVGWYTHYHDLYLPALVWAALSGLQAVGRYRDKRAARLVPALAALLVVSVFFYRPAAGRLSADAFKDAFIFRLPAEAQLYLSPYGTELRAGAQRLQSAVPSGAMISTVEGGMPLIYSDRTIEFYPIGIDRAGYLLVGRSVVNGRTVISGFATKLGPSEQAKIDAGLDRRLRRNGFDLDHPDVETLNGLALFRRRPLAP